MTTFVEVPSEGSLNGTTAVDVVTAPASGTRRLVRSVNFYNADTVPHTITLSKYVGGTVRAIAKETISPGENWTFDDHIIVLDSTTRKVQAVCQSATVTTAPTFDATSADVT